MVSYLYLYAYLLVTFTGHICIAIEDISSDVEYLREQYDQGKDEANNLIVKYHGNQIHDGDLLLKEQTQLEPDVQINFKVDPEMPYLTLVMADPDAPRRDHEVAGPWLHWIKGSFHGKDLINGKTLMEYQGPSPPDGTGQHQYVFLLYKSATSDLIWHAAVNGEGGVGDRARFPVQNFEISNKLKLIGTTSFFVNAKNINTD